MSLYRQNAIIQAQQGNLLGELFEFFEFTDPNDIGADTRESFLRKIGESLGMDESYIEKAIKNF